MKREVTIEAEAADGVSLLSRISDVLSSSPPPECLVWSTMPETNEARIWMVLPIEEGALQDVLVRLRQLTGVKSVTPLGPGAAILRLTNGTSRPAT